MNRTQSLTRISRGLLVQTAGRSASPLVAEVLRLTDPEAVSSLPGIANAYNMRTAQIHSDRELSDVGKRERMKSVADGAAGHVGKLAKRVAELEAQHRTTRANAVQLPKADAADVLLDIELAKFIRESEPIPSKLTAMSERVRIAMARLPVEITGLTTEVQASVLGSLVSPELAVQFAEEEQALSAARSVVQSAINEVAPVAELSPRDMVQTFGTRWRLPGLTDTYVERVQDELKAEAVEVDEAA